MAAAPAQYDITPIGLRKGCGLEGFKGHPCFCQVSSQGKFSRNSRDQPAQGGDVQVVCLNETERQAATRLQDAG